MKVIVPCKSIRNPYTGLASPFSLNPFDEVALEEAVAWVERGLAKEVLVVSIGAEETELPIRHAIAKGATRAIRIDAGAPLEPLCIARALAAIVGKEGGDVLLMGKLSADEDNGQVGPMVAGLLGWPQITSVTATSVDVAGVTVTCRRQADGREQLVQSCLPAVITADIRLNKPRPTNLLRLTRALKGPLEVMSLESLGVRPSCRSPLVKTVARPPRKAPERLVDVDALFSRIGTHLSP